MIETVADRQPSTDQRRVLQTIANFGGTAAVFAILRRLDRELPAAEDLPSGYTWELIVKNGWATVDTYGETEKRYWMYSLTPAGYATLVAA
ncbi:MAG TPA: hypothetical protein VHA75_08780 [Rugosimonospora sp.]|nr:hypothetical protein [Rugosimonospora sp.]